MIDMHTHAFPDDVAPRALQKLSTLADWQPIGDGTLAGLLDAMDHADLDVAVLAPIATKPGQAKGILKWGKRVAKTSHGRVIPLASLHPDDKDPVGWVDRLADKGILGIKLHPFYQDFVVDEPRLWPIYAACQEHGLLVELHCGSDLGFADDPKPDRAAPARVATVLDQFSSLKLLCTHMGGWNMWDDVGEHLLGRDVYLETSFCRTFLDARDFTRLVLDHGPDKICMGSDWPWNDPAVEIEFLRSLGLDQQTESQLLFRTAAGLLGF